MTELQELHAKWLKDDPAYAAEYRAMEPEFALARESIRARTAAGMTQEEVAQRRKAVAVSHSPARSNATLKPPVAG